MKAEHKREHVRQTKQVTVRHCLHIHSTNTSLLVREVVSTAGQANPIPPLVSSKAALNTSSLKWIPHHVTRFVYISGVTGIALNQVRP